MLKVYSITALALVQAFVLFIGLTNANTVSYCKTVCQQVTSVSSSTSTSVSSSTSASVSSSASVGVSSTTSASVSAPSVSSSASANVSAPSVSSSTSASVSAPSVSSSASASVSAPSVSSSASASVSASTSASVSAPSVSSTTSASVSAPSVSASTSASVSAPGVSANTSASVSAPGVSASTSASVSAPGVSSSTSASVSAPSVSSSTSASVSSSTSTSVSASTSTSVSSSTSASVSTTCSIVCETPGSTVIICLLVKVSYCNATLYGNTSSSESQALLANLTTNVKNVFAKEYVIVIEVEIISIICIPPTYVLICIRVTFKLGIKQGFFIETHLNEEIKHKSLGDLPVNNTHSNVTFEGVTLTYDIKGGECQRVCCGAGGSVVLVQKCTPSSKCEGILAKEKEEAGHCHGEQNDLCTGNAVCTTTASEITPSPSKSSPCTVTMSTTPDKNAKCSEWEAGDNQCEKCSDGGGGPIKIKRKCTVENQNSCDYVINEEEDSTDCVKYCDGSSHSPSVALVLLLTIVTAFRYTVY